MLSTAAFIMHLSSREAAHPRVAWPLAGAPLASKRPGGIPTSVSGRSAQVPDTLIQHDESRKDVLDRRTESAFWFRSGTCVEGTLHVPEERIQARSSAQRGRKVNR